jgi:hypothetical protein
MVLVEADMDLMTCLFSRCTDYASTLFYKRGYQRLGVIKRMNHVPRMYLQPLVKLKGARVISCVAFLMNNKGSMFYKDLEVL